MGVLKEGEALAWPETKKLAEHVKNQGLQQFINTFQRLKDREGDVLKWGDEVEYMVVKFDDEKKTAKLSLNTCFELLPILNEREQADPQGVKSVWRPEYAAYMIEGTPGQPYGCSLSHFNLVEANMRFRRQEVTQLLDASESIISITNFLRSGTPNFTYPDSELTPNSPDSISRSIYYPDEAICAHARYRAVTANLRGRKGANMDINVNVAQDVHTKLPIPGSPPGRPSVVHMDAMGFGFGCCCLQITFQANNITEARKLYDQLTPMTSIMLALTAASPAFRGFLVDSDCRWSVIGQSVDCRTPQEKGEAPQKENQFHISKTRCSSIDSYLSPAGERYNDNPVPYHKEHYQKLRDAGVDHLLAQHVAHLFIRDSVLLYGDRVDQDDPEETEHFESIQSTNWQTMRFKPPPPKSSIGWRVEFRPCEIQLTDFENAAFCCFIVLLTRVILSFQLNLLIPISKVDDNILRAQHRNAYREQLFWFRKNITKKPGDDVEATDDENVNEVAELMSIDQIFNGKNGFPGLIPLIQNYLESMDVDTDTHCTIQKYLRFIEQRAAGKLLTAASWIRKEVTSHPDYKQDSVVSELINYDLLKKIEKLQNAEISCPELVGIDRHTKSSESFPKAIQKLVHSHT